MLTFFFLHTLVAVVSFSFFTSPSNSNSFKKIHAQRSILIYQKISKFKKIDLFFFFY